MNVIVAVNSDWGIGFKGTQQIVIPEDRKQFIILTRGGVVIGGRKTFEDCGGPLPGRKNILLTRDENFTIDGATVVNSVKQAFDAIPDGYDSKAFIIGGGEIYNNFLPLCEHAYVTKIDSSPVSDTFFPNLDNMPNWTLEHTSVTYEHKIESKDSIEMISFVFAVYRNKDVIKP